MKNLRQRITNPMTVIAIFATLSETSAAVSLPFLDNDDREIYIWFLISFPFYLLLLFFVTLNFNYRSLYAPSDFEKSKHFIKAMDNAEPNENADKCTHQRSGGDHDPAEAIGRQTCYPIHPPVRLPALLKDLHIIDTRWMNRKADYRELLDTIRQSGGDEPQVIVLLTVAESEALLKESVMKYGKSARKRKGSTFCVVYSLSTKEATVIDQACQPDAPQSATLLAQ